MNNYNMKEMNLNSWLEKQTDAQQTHYKQTKLQYYSGPCGQDYLYIPNLHRPIQNHCCRNPGNLTLLISVSANSH